MRTGGAAESQNSLGGGCDARLGWGGSVSADEGAALVEMALSASVFFVVLIGIVYLIFCLYTYNFVADAAREATRYASTRGTECSVNTPGIGNCNVSPAQLQTWVRSMNYPGMSAANLSVTATWLRASTTGATSWIACSPGPCTKAPGNMVQVRVTYSYPISVPFLVGTTIDVSSVSQMVISQ